MTTAFLYPLILFAGVLQAMGPPMNGQLRISLTNPWLANPRVLRIGPGRSGRHRCHLPAPAPHRRRRRGDAVVGALGGLIGALAVGVGLLFVDRVGPGALAGLTISANLIMSLVIDKYRLLNMPVHPLSMWRAIDGLLMVAGVGLIAWF